MHGYRPVPRARLDDLTGQADVSRFVSPDLLRFCPLIPKVALAYNQLTDTLLWSAGVASISDDGPGLFTINFERDFDGVDYALSGNADPGEGSINRAWALGLVARAADSVQVETSTSASPPVRGDCAYVAVTIWGNPA